VRDEQRRRTGRRGDAAFLGGCAEESAPAAALSAVLERSVQRRGAAGSSLALVFTRCSFLVDGAPVGVRDPHSVTLAPGSVVDVLPPFAGG